VVIPENPAVDGNNKPHWSVRLCEWEKSAIKTAHAIKELNL